MSKFSGERVEESKSKTAENKTFILLLKMRKAKPKKRVVLPDPVFNDVKVSKFVNHLMYDGKKNTSY